MEQNNIFELLGEKANDIYFDLMLDFSEKKERYQTICACYLDNNNNFSILLRTFDVIEKSCSDIFFDMHNTIENYMSRCRMVGLMSTRYNIDWYKKFLDRHRIDYQIDNRIKIS